MNAPLRLNYVALQEMSHHDLLSYAWDMTALVTHVEGHVDQVGQIAQHALAHWDHALTQRDELVTLVRNYHRRAHVDPWPICPHEMCGYARAPKP